MTTRRAAPLLLVLALTLAACGPATPKGPPLPPELEKPYPWRLAPTLTEVGREAYFEWFAERAVDDETRAFVRAHGPALAEVRLNLEEALKDVEGARIMTRGHSGGRRQLKSAASVEEKILRLWKGSVEAWAAGKRGLFGRNATLAEARGQIFEATPGSPRAITDVAGLRVILPDLATLDAVTADRRTAWKGRIIKHRDYVGKDHRGDGYRSVHFVIKAHGRPVEVQLRTRRMDRWAAWEHKLVYKGPYQDDPSVHAYTKAVADRLHLRDQGTCPAPCALPACPTLLQDAEACFPEEAP